MMQRSPLRSTAMPPDKVRINLSDAIGYLNGTVAGGNAAEPGDTLYYNIKLVNESNKGIEYDPAKATIGTIRRRLRQERK